MLPLSFQRAEAARCYRANTCCPHPERPRLSESGFCHPFSNTTLVWQAGSLDGKSAAPLSVLTTGEWCGSAVDSWRRPERTSVGVACPDPRTPGPSPAPAAESQGSRVLEPTGWPREGCPALSCFQKNQRPPSHGPGGTGWTLRSLPTFWGEWTPPARWWLSWFQAGLGTEGGLATLLEALTPAVPAARPAQPGFPQAGLTRFPALAAKLRTHGHF